MRLTEVLYPGRPPVDGYGPGFFRVGGEVLAGDLLLLPSGVRSWALRGDLSAALAEAGAIDVLLIGTGAEIARWDRGMVAALEAAGLGVEVMATPPAARTYNVLLGEGRRVAAALCAV